MGLFSSNSAEKVGGTTAHVEQHRDHSPNSDLKTTSSDDNEMQTEFSPAEQKKILRRIDKRLIITVGAMYMVSLMDRTNLSNASIAGMRQELGMIKSAATPNGNPMAYSIVTLVFFTTYVFFQPPATVLTKKIGPRNFLATICFLWGCTMIAMGFVKTWQQLAALRVVLGIFEAGFFPGCVYLLSTWYCRYEMGRRNAFFYLIGMLASAFSGILAFGLMQMDGLGGYQGWSWIFIIEGIITVIIAIVGYIFLVPFPDDNPEKCWGFLNEREVAFVIARVNADRGDAQAEPFNLVKFLKPAADLKIWGFAIMFACNTTQSYALAFFLPIILVVGMGFEVGAAQCLVAPPYAFAAIVMLITATIADKYKIRGPLIIFNATCAIIGLALMGWVETVGVRYFGVFLVCSGANANIPQVMSYQGNNIRGQWKRAFCSATLVGFGGIGGIAGSLVFRTQDAPGYIPGLWACIAASLLMITTCCCLNTYFYFANKKQARGGYAIEGADDGFRYTY
ncbi:phthalate transporter like protein [Zymoseptoria brevis]|uniref:Phthalate transporter like protein n=1 Tax=Zymoseptoria brevis TaxID=1047168 RepID=A0A0F4GFC6_9PEZI|nr:phthalate transporter like protein [Zymoseptoria brevis]